MELSMRIPNLIGLALISLAVSSCGLSTAAEVITAPIDALTTTKSERDEDRGRELRKREERLGKLERRYREQTEDCQAGDQEACLKARETYDEIQELLPTIPVEPDR